MGLATAGWKGRGGPLPDLEAEGGIWRAEAGGEYREAQPSGERSVTS